MSDYCIVFMTAANRDEADRIARALVEKRLAACVQIVADIRSVYWWDGRVCDEPEILLTAKTTSGLFDELAAEVKRLHSYDVPEVVCVPVVDAVPEYLSWISDVTR